MRTEIVVSKEPRRLFSFLARAARNAIGWCLEKIKAPARVGTFEFVDPNTDQTIYLYTSSRYSVLCVGERRFYFDRISGKFDGVSAPAGLVPDWVEFSD